MKRILPSPANASVHCLGGGKLLSSLAQAFQCNPKVPLGQNLPETGTQPEFTMQ